VAILAAMFFLAGRLSYWQAWGYGASGLLFGLVVAVLFAGKPDVIEERVRPGPGMKWWDKVFFALYIPCFLAILGVASLDAGRHHWTPPLPVSAYVAAYMVLAVAYWLVTWAMWINRFFSSVVRIQADRGHHVVQDGPYRFIRHPGYVGAILLGLASAVALGSLWSLIPAGLMAMLVTVRTALEDATLQRELPGYTEYASKVRYRLLPGVW
jgi:protein-S-isoprenylcysteine O-methyltransferase Ste14